MLRRDRQKQEVGFRETNGYTKSIVQRGYLHIYTHPFTQEDCTVQQYAAQVPPLKYGSYTVSFDTYNRLLIA